MWLDIQHGHFCIRYCDTRGVGGRHQVGPHRQTGLGRRVGNVVSHQIKGPQRTPRPGSADLAEQAMLNRVPFRGARGIMAHRDGQSQPICELHLELLLPDARAGAVAAAAIRFDQQGRGLRIAFAQFCPTPLRNSIHREGRRISGAADIHAPPIRAQVIDAIGDGASDRILREIVGIDFLWALAPDLSWILKVADQFFLLGVHADHWVAFCLMRRALGANIGELLITIRMLLASMLLRNED